MERTPGRRSMELLFLFVGSALLGWLAARSGFRLDDGRAVASIVTGLQRTTNDWPIGVQEEDRDQPWGKGPAPAPDLDPPPVVNVTRVESAVRLHKSSRSTR